jgi:3-dehydroquinate synthase
MLKFYHNFYSPYSRSVWIAIQAKKIGVELIGHPTTNLLQTSFNYEPTIVDDGFEIVGSLAILDYLEARYPNPSLLPQEAKLLATVRMVETICLDRLLSAIAPLFSQFMGWAKSNSNLEQSEQQILSILTQLENLLQNNTYFGGYDITLADVVAGTAIPLLPSLGITLDEFPQLKAWSLRLMKWSAWIATQPHWQRNRVSSSIRAVANSKCHQIRRFKSDSALDLPAIEQAFSVNFQYNVHFTKNLFASDNSLLANVIAPEQEAPQKAIAVVDEGLLTHYPSLLTQIKDYARQWSDRFQLQSEPIVVLAGEAAKNDPEIVNQIHSAIEQGGICRHSYVLALGGGAVLDMVGYAAATAHRGIRLIRIPTTVLAQNDSGVGVKNSINAFGKKNFFGTFAPPYAVLNDVQFLTTLDDRDWRSGIAEAIKVALIKDRAFFTSIADSVKAIANRDLDKMSQVIYRCAQLHLQHIATSGDAFEAGSSRPLDFGHWAAHRLEYLTDYRLRHGEAVAIGIALDCTYSYLLGLLPYSQWLQILTTLTGLGFDLYVPELDWKEKPNSLFEGVEEFREHLGGELTLMLLPEIGRGMEVHQVDLCLYEQAIAIIKEFAYAPKLANAS